LGGSPRTVRCRLFWPQALERAVPLDWIGATRTNDAAALLMINGLQQSGIEYGDGRSE